jgi:hypothetical protein
MSDRVIAVMQVGATNGKSVWELYGPLITAGFALLGVLLAGLVNWFTMGRQLRNASIEATRAREFQVRRGVYLEAAEAIAAGNTTLASMLDTSIPNADIRTALADTFGKLAKTNVIGSLATLTAVKSYTCAMNEAAAKLWPVRFQMIRLDQITQRLQNVIDEQFKDQARWVEAMKQANVEAAAGRPQPQVFQMLQQQAALSQRNANDAQGKQNAVTQVRQALAMRVIETTIGELQNLQGLLPAALGAARAELDLGVDEGAVRSLFGEIAERGQAALRDSIQRSRALAAEVDTAVQPILAPQPPPVERQ